MTVEFIYKNLNQEPPTNPVKFSSMCYAEDAVENCVAFVSEDSKIEKYIQVAQMLKQQHAAMPPNSPTRLSNDGIDKYVNQLQMKETGANAIKKGAVLLISTFQIEDYPCIVVPNVANALCHLVSCYLNEFNVSTVQITGSFGKTSMWQLVNTMLESSGKNVLKNTLNKNGIRGVLDSLSRLDKNHEFYVQELQENVISLFTSNVLKPKVGIITSVGTTHLSPGITKDYIAQTLLKMQDGIPKQGTLIINGDDILLKKYAAQNSKITYYGIRYGNAEYLATNIKQNQNNICFDIIYDENKSQHIQMTGLGTHNVHNALAAFITGKCLNLTNEEIAKGIKSYKPQGVRQNLTEVQGRTIYLDCYNASPETMTASVKYLSDVNTSGRRIAVLGSMAELAHENETGHMKVGYAVMQANIDLLICHGHNASIIADVAKDNPKLKIYKTKEHEHVAQLLQQETKEGDFILVKGSRITRLEHAIDMAFGTYFTTETEVDYEKDIIASDDYEIMYSSYTFHATITKYLGQKKEISTFPCSLFGIASGAFADNNTLHSITLPNTLKVIGENAFSNCTSLKKVYIAPSTINISKNAFSKNITIYGQSNSFAETYAKTNGIPFIVHENTINFKPVPLSEIKDDGFLTLVNTNHPLLNIPDADVFSLAEPMIHVTNQKTVFVNLIVLSNAKHMLMAAKDDGFTQIAAQSGFRSFNQQSQIYNNSTKTGQVAPPGCSEHHTGLALDIAAIDDEHFKWLADNAHRFGFILRYPIDKTHITQVPHEPWHFRYVGKLHAHYMKQNNLVLEEYIDLIKSNKQLTIDFYGKPHEILYKTANKESISVPNAADFTISSDNIGGYIITLL